MSKTAQPPKGSGSNVHSLQDQSSKEASTDGASPAAAKSESTKLNREEKLKEEHLDSVVKQLGVNDCSKLYNHLDGLSDADVTRLKKGNDVAVDTEQEARNVFIAWIKKERGKATRQAVLVGLEKCDNNLAKGNLEDIWLEGTVPLKEDDITNIIEVGELGPNEIESLFGALGMKQYFIDQKRQVKRKNVELQAKAVLLGWIKLKTPTVGGLLKTLENAGNLNASEELQEKWGITETPNNPGEGNKLGEMKEQLKFEKPNQRNKTESPVKQE